MGREDEAPGFFAPVHRALAEPILLGGAPRSLAIVNGTLAGAIGLGLRLWIAGLLLWALGHALAVWAARRRSELKISTVAPPILSTKHWAVRWASWRPWSGKSESYQPPTLCST